MNQSENRKSPPASILVLSANTDRWFSSPEAYAELLYLEGINDVETAYLDALTPAMLEGRSLVLLGAADPEPEAVQWLIDFAYHGGGLICCRKSAQFTAGSRKTRDASRPARSC